MRFGRLTRGFQARLVQGRQDLLFLFFKGLSPGLLLFQAPGDIVQPHFQFKDGRTQLLRLNRLGAALCAGNIQSIQDLPFLLFKGLKPGLLLLEGGGGGVQPPLQLFDGEGESFVFSGRGKKAFFSGGCFRFLGLDYRL